MDSTFVVGIDVGGQTSKLGVVDARGTVLAQTVIRTDTYTEIEPYIAELAEAVKKIIKEAGVEGNVRGIGVGAPNGNYYNGTIENAVNLSWGGAKTISFSKLLSEAMGGLPVALTNDANAAAVGEMTYGAARGMKNFIMITLGTGVGSGIVCDGRVIYGSDGFAGELGHVIVDHTDAARPCGCGRKGCLETYCSATGVARTARLVLESSSEASLLRKHNIDDITSFDVFQAAEQGDKLALEIFEETGRRLGAACADFAAFSSPEAFIFFGGLTKAGDYIMDPIKRAYDENVLFVYKGKAKLLVSTLNGSEAAVLGASALGWE